jgi:hypothetical protein
MSVIIPDNVSGRNVFPFPMASGLGQSSVDAYDCCCDKDEYVTPRSVAEMTP